MEESNQFLHEGTGYCVVDVDDLVALAIALDVAPNRLLLDPESDQDELTLTAEVVTSRQQAWNWATGAEPLQSGPFADSAQRVSLDLDRFGKFRNENRPNEPESETTLAELAELGERFAPVVAAVTEALDAGASFDQLIEYLALWKTLRGTVQAMVDKHPDNPANAKRAHKSAARKKG